MYKLHQSTNTTNLINSLLSSVNCTADFFYLLFQSGDGTFHALYTSHQHISLQEHCNGICMINNYASLSDSLIAYTRKYVRLPTRKCVRLAACAIRCYFNNIPRTIAIMCLYTPANRALCAFAFAFLYRMSLEPLQLPLTGPLTKELST